MVELGQIRLIELTGSSTLPAADRAALDGADVVLYEHALAETVAALLPDGVYAEPVSAGSLRAVRLASDGWRVVQCVRAGPRSDNRHPAAVPATVRRPPQSLAFTANGLAG